MNLDNYQKGSITFLAGCLSFTYDSIKKTPISRPYILGCGLFNIGCIYFIKDSFGIKK